jgi:enolase-phosphatase E1
VSWNPDTRGILLDIEGTTTPIVFVYQTLFPYAEARLGTACAMSEEKEYAEAVCLLREDWDREPAEVRSQVGDFEDGAPYARFLMREDRKSTGLKALQGVIWRDGYQSGKLKGEVFEDVPRALARWKEQGRRTRIYSSGSVLAQKLIFGHSDQGDLTEWIEDYHDTTTGPKKDAESYRRIAESYGLAPEEILFLSDNLEELDAARKAGCQTGLSVRPGNPTVEPHDHPSIDTFDSVFP